MQQLQDQSSTHFFFNNGKVYSIKAGSTTDQGVAPGSGQRPGCDSPSRPLALTDALQHTDRICRVQVSTVHPRTMYM